MSGLRWSKTEDSEEWDDFVSKNDGSIFHTWAWRRARESSGERALYLACRDGQGTLVAVCPFFYRKAPRRLLYLESLPTSPIGGPVIDTQLGNASEIIGSLQKSVSFTIRNPAVSLQFRIHKPSMIQPLLDTGLRYETSQGLFVLDLTSKTRGYTWNEEFDKHDRQAVKYYEDRASVFSFARDEEDFMEYQTLHQETMSRSGESSRSLEYISSLRLNFGERFKIALVTLEDRLIAGFMMLCDPKISTVHLGLNIGYSKIKNMHSPMVYTNWKIVNWASEEGFRTVNFGRTATNSKDPVHKLKQKFASEFIPVYRVTVPTARIPYSAVKSIDRKIRGMGRSLVSRVEE
jgi:Acetyltransferase (GNAT) domain